MGANLLVLAGTLLLQSFQHDTANISEQPSHGIAYERLSDLLQYNRVQGLSFGLGYQTRLPGFRSTHAYATLRYGLSDDRVTGRLTLLREVSGSRVALSGYSDVADLDPLSPGRTLGNTLNGILAGHDNADYALAQGGSARWGTSIGTRLDLTLEARVERQSSMARVARSAVNDFLGGTGIFPPNPRVEEGTFGALSVKVSRLGGTAWSLSSDVLGGAGQVTARLFGDIRGSLGRERQVSLRIMAGAGTEPGLPQTLFRLGGVYTVRGFEYGTLRAPAFWAARLDVAPLSGRVRPVVFIDTGQAAPIADLISSTALVGGGAGLSLLGGLIRFDLSRPISPDGGGKLRFDLVIKGLK
jgi:hypothetical protein